MIVIHWLTALLVLAAWLTSEGGRGVAENPPMLHFTLGLSVLVLVLPRLILRLVGGAPECRPRLRIVRQELGRRMMRHRYMVKVWHEAHVSLRSMLWS